MDPLSALGLAGNLVQFIEFGSSLISESREIYRSTTGLSNSQIDLELVYNDLLDITNTLDFTTQASNAIVNHDPVHTLATRCRALAQELLEIIRALKIEEQTKHRKWQSFKQALRGIGKASKIEDLSSRLKELRIELSLRLTVMFNDRQSSVQHMLREMAIRNAEFEAQRSEEIKSLTTSIADLSRRIANPNTAMFARDLPRAQDLTKISEEARVLRREQAVLSSLRYKSIAEREAKISPAHAQTFEWVFDSDADVGFSEWLQGGTGLFWISGKPGSGKSTLMKFLCRHEQSKVLLSKWALESKLVMAQYFFWLAGTPMQKSCEGLLRSLIYEVFRQCPEVIAIIPSISLSLHSLEETTPAVDFWNLERLSLTMLALMSYEHMPTKFCFFIDGLDEFEGRHEDLIAMINTWKSVDSTNIKICLSSRPWSIFEDAYGATMKQKLYMEQLTRPDIQLYVEDKLSAYSRPGSLERKETGFEQLVDEIVDRASGVFLWIYLVIQSLTDGLTNGDSIEQLYSRVEALPRNLEDFFRQIILSIDPVYSRQMARTFLIAMRANEPLTLLAHHFIEVDDVEFGLDSVEKVENYSIFNIHSKMQRKITGRYKGLLEVTNEQHPNVVFTRRVHFLHRTVIDFLRLKDIQELLNKEYFKPKFRPQTMRWEPKEQINPRSNPELELCNLYLLLIKTMSLSKRDLIEPGMLQDCMGALLHHARQVELEFEWSPIEYIDALRYFIEDVQSTFDCGINWILSDDSVLGLMRVNSFWEAVTAARLCLYLKEKITQMPHMNLHQPTSALKGLLRMTRLSAADLGGTLEMLTFLLQNGADPNAKIDGLTIWSQYLRESTVSQTGVPQLSRNVSLVRQQYRVMEVLLLHGCEPNTIVDSRVTWGNLVVGIRGLPGNCGGAIAAYMDIVRLFLRSGADPNAVYASNITQRSGDRIAQITQIPAFDQSDGGEPLGNESVWSQHLKGMVADRHQGSTIASSRSEVDYELTGALLQYGAKLDIQVTCLNQQRILQTLSPSQVIRGLFTTSELARLNDVIRRARLLQPPWWQKLLRVATYDSMATYSRRVGTLTKTCFMLLNPRAMAFDRYVKHLAHSHSDAMLDSSEPFFETLPELRILRCSACFDQVWESSEKKTWWSLGTSGIEDMISCATGDLLNSSYPSVNIKAEWDKVIYGSIEIDAPTARFRTQTWPHTTKWRRLLGQTIAVGYVQLDLGTNSKVVNVAPRGVDALRWPAISCDKNGQFDLRNQSLMLFLDHIRQATELKLWIELPLQRHVNAFKRLASVP